MDLGSELADPHAPEIIITGMKRAVVKDAADPNFRPLELAPFSGRPWRTAQVRGEILWGC